MVDEILKYSRSRLNNSKAEGPKKLLLALKPMLNSEDKTFYSSSISSNTTADSREIAKKTSEVESIIAFKEAKRN